MSINYSTEKSNDDIPNGYYVYTESPSELINSAVFDQKYGLPTKNGASVSSETRTNDESVKKSGPPSAGNILLLVFFTVYLCFVCFVTLQASLGFTQCPIDKNSVLVWLVGSGLLLAFSWVSLGMLYFIRVHKSSKSSSKCMTAILIGLPLMLTLIIEFWFLFGLKRSWNWSQVQYKDPTNRDTYCSSSVFCLVLPSIIAMLIYFPTSISVMVCCCIKQEDH